MLWQVTVAELRGGMPELRGGMVTSGPQRRSAECTRMFAGSDIMIALGESRNPTYRPAAAAEHDCVMATPMRGHSIVHMLLSGPHFTI